MTDKTRHWRAWFEFGKLRCEFTRIEKICDKVATVECNAASGFAKQIPTDTLSFTKRDAIERLKNHIASTINANLRAIDSLSIQLGELNGWRDE